MAVVIFFSDALYIILYYIMQNRNRKSARTSAREAVILSVRNCGGNFNNVPLTEENDMPRGNSIFTTHLHDEKQIILSSHDLPSFIFILTSKTFLLTIVKYYKIILTWTSKRLNGNNHTKYLPW